MKGNRIPRPTATLYSDERVKVPKWVIRGLGLEPGQKFAISVWKRGEKLRVDMEAAIVFELVEDGD